MAVTSNTDSCNLSRVDVSQVVHSAVIELFPGELASGSSAVAASGVTNLPLSVPSAGGGAPKILHARPSWVEMAPDNDAGGKPSTHGYENGTPGFCGGRQSSRLGGAARLQLVVKVRLENDGITTPTIEKALHVDKSGVSEVTDLSTIECPVECAGVAGSGGVSDLGPPADMAGPSDMGATNLPSSRAWPSAIAVDVEPDISGIALAGRLVIGDGYGERVDIIPFDVKKATFGTAASVTLNPGDNGLLQPGVRVVRVGPRSEAGKFLYAVARDGTVRVIDLDRNAECETNADPRYQSATLNLQQTPTRADVNSPWSFPLPPPRSLGCFPARRSGHAAPLGVRQYARHLAAAGVRSRSTSPSCTSTRRPAIRRWRRHRRRPRRACSSATSRGSSRATAKAPSSTSTTPARSRISSR